MVEKRKTKNLPPSRILFENIIIDFQVTMPLGVYFKQQISAQ